MLSETIGVETTNLYVLGPLIVIYTNIFLGQSGDALPSAIEKDPEKKTCIIIIS